MRRLLSKKGSVLFLVVVVMSILIIAASATYYIVNNQHSSVNVRYSSEQSYQTAVSVSETVSNYIDGYIAAICSSGQEMSKYKDTIIGKMISMSVGSSNDISSEIPLDEGMGEATVTIRKTDTQSSGDNTIYIFEITTEAEVNGETVQITQVKEIVMGPTEYFTRFLTSTGNHPDDVNITANKIISGAYFENDFTRLSNAVLNESIFSSGTFYDNGINYNAPTKEIVVAKNLYHMGFGNPVVCDKIYVGGNLETNASLDVNEVYVLGDITINQGQANATYYINGNCTINGDTRDCTFYINGNLILKGVIPQGTFSVKGDVILDGFTNAAVDCQYGGTLTETSPTGGDWTGRGFTQNAAIGIPFSDTSTISTYISNATAKQKYDKWDAEKYFVENFPYYVENVITDPNGDLISYDIVNSVVPGSDADSYVSGETATANQHTYFPNTWTAVCTITESCALQSWSDTGFSRLVGGYPQNYNCWEGVEQSIVIDTGPKRGDGKELYILLDKGAKSYFSFGAKDDTRDVKVYIKGDYPVIFVLPDGTSYKSTPNLFIGHVNLAIEMCGCTDYNDLLSKTQIFGYFTGAANVAKIEGYIETIPAADATSQPTAFIKSGSDIPDFHNSIFFVSNSYTDVIDMNTENFFYGYLYAPNAKFWVNSGGSGQEMIQFLGGMIVGSYYYYKFNAALAYLTPNDYKDVYSLTQTTDIVKKLISIANGGGGGGGDLEAILKPSTGVSPTLGYK